jgi:hypothetical protein
MHTHIETFTKQQEHLYVCVYVTVALWMFLYVCVYVTVALWMFLYMCVYVTVALWMFLYVCVMFLVNDNSNIYTHI